MMVAAGTTRIGFLGLGTMGRPMAVNLAKAGFPLTVWNRTPAKVQPLLALGARAGKGPAHVAAEADLVITMVSTPKDVEELALGPDGVVDGLRPGTIFMDMSTVSPATSRKLAGAVAAKQAEFLDAPVVGSLGPATEGTLTILVGGLPTTLERARPALAAMGKTLIHAGDIGMGSTLKLAVNLMLAHLVSAFAEGLLLVQRAGGEPKKYLEALDAGGFRSPWYQSKGVGMLKREFAPHFALKHMHKDVRLMTELAEETGTAAPITNAIRQLYAASEESGLGDLDYSAILAFLEGASTPA